MSTLCLVTPAVTLTALKPGALEALDPVQQQTLTEHAIKQGHEVYLIETSGGRLGIRHPGQLPPPGATVLVKVAPNKTSA